MGALMRQYDWASSCLGSAQFWPQSLRVTIRLMLNSQHPMFIWWGKDLVQFYNDAYSTTMGPAMHPKALGAKGRQTWADIWPIIGPQIEQVMAGRGATWNEEQLVPINRTGMPENVWWTYGYSPIDLEGGIGGVLVVCNDVTQQHLNTEALRAQAMHLQLQFEQAPGFIITTRGPDHVFETVNAAYRKLIGARDYVGRTVREVIPEIADQGYYELLDRVYQTGEPFVGRRMPVDLKLAPDQPVKRSYVDFIYQATREADGSISGIFCEGQDVTDHVLGEERLKLINGELQHRVKNTLAMVQAIASQTLQQVEAREPVDTFLQRLVALGRAHDTLVQEDWSAAEMRKAVLASIEGLTRSNSIEVSGPDVLLGPSATLALSMILHELITNAVKYGALSNDVGKVRIAWMIEGRGENRELVFLWKERGGPPVTKPKRTGFGSKLVGMGLDGNGTVKINFDPEGFSAEIKAPFEQLQRR